MSIPIPRSKPAASLATVIAAAEKAWKMGHTLPLPDFFVLGVRAYYRDSMGEPGVNDVSQYDDAFFIVSPLGFSAWNGNTDPSRYGWNDNADKYMARLKTGCWTFIRRMHRGKYWAFGQGDNEVVVERIKSTDIVATSERGCFGIDLHLGGINGTSSEGCVTVPPSQWTAFEKELTSTMKSLGETEFPFILIDGPIN